jgi:hypothetical protein
MSYSNQPESQGRLRRHAESLVRASHVYLHDGETKDIINVEAPPPPSRIWEPASSSAPATSGSAFAGFGFEADNEAVRRAEEVIAADHAHAGVEAAPSKRAMSPSRTQTYNEGDAGPSASSFGQAPPRRAPGELDRPVGNRISSRLRGDAATLLYDLIFLDSDDIKGKGKAKLDTIDDKSDCVNFGSDSEDDYLYSDTSESYHSSSSDSHDSIISIVRVEERRAKRRRHMTSHKRGEGSTLLLNEPIQPSRIINRLLLDWTSLSKVEIEESEVGESSTEDGLVEDLAAIAQAANSRRRSRPVC